MDRPIAVSAGDGAGGAKSWGEFGVELLALYQPPLRSRRTQGSIRRTLRRLADLGGVRSTADLTPLAIASLIQGLAAAGLGRITIHGVLGYARVICQYAVDAGYLARSPFSARRKWIRRGLPDPDRVRHVPLAEVRRLLQALGEHAESWEGHRLWAVTAVVAYCGLRRDEALRLQVVDVDLVERVIRLREHDPLFGPLKTEGSAVPVGVPPELVEVLAGWLPRVGSPWLFPGKRGRGPWVGGAAGSRALDHLQRFARSIGVEGVTFQALRHSWATHAEGVWGLTEPMIQRMLRHATTRTQAHYRHADMANLRAIADRVRYLAA